MGAALALALLYASTASTSYEVLRPGRVRVRVPSSGALELRFIALNRTFELAVFRQAVFADGARISVVEGGRVRALAAEEAAATYSGLLDGGRGWAHVTLGAGGVVRAALFTRTREPPPGGGGGSVREAARAGFRLFRLVPLSTLRGHARLAHGQPEHALIFYTGELPFSDGAAAVELGCGAHHAARAPSAGVTDHGLAEPRWWRRAWSSSEAEPAKSAHPAHSSEPDWWPRPGLGGEPPPRRARVGRALQAAAGGAGGGAAAEADPEDGGTVEERAGRMCHCPLQPRLLMLNIGLLVDAGFVNVTGGARGAAAEVSHMLQLANAVFTEQLGVFVRAKRLVINADQSGSFAQSGPNFAPVARTGAPGPCPSPVTPGRNAMSARWSGGGGTARVGVEGVGALLSRVGTWAEHHGADAPAASGAGNGGESSQQGHGIGAWHLLTACTFGPAIGVASIGTACAPDFGPTTVSDSGAPCDGTCDFQLDNGNAAQPVGARGAAGCAADPSEHCSGAHVAVASFVSSDTLWRTFAHELAHNLNAPHVEHGLMAPTGSRATRPRFFDDGTLCEYVSTLAERAPSCLAPAERACGNGRLESPEECDDGGTADGDGCTSTCSLERASPSASPGAPAPPPPSPPPGAVAYDPPPSPPRPPPAPVTPPTRAPALVAYFSGRSDGIYDPYGSCEAARGSC
ncbi:hypothetical protein KFE25_011518 [Diacronema lutheri]|uniref:Peptidase M12B domain-containing protein n=1 Tax=Diacronema lutheri TaxID=2081491 RepID=A0A8J6CC16_DIALT|nr:hypothetical protein KFE25_011518 [Diacronema lutheri]